jgi:hypothetical protein
MYCAKPLEHMTGLLNELARLAYICQWFRIVPMSLTIIKIYRRNEQRD